MKSTEEFIARVASRLDAAIVTLARTAAHAARRVASGLARRFRDHAEVGGVAVLLLLVQDGRLPNPIDVVLTSAARRPVTPAPAPAPAPVPVQGRMRVLVLRESSAPTTAGRLRVINSTAIRAYLAAKCMVDSGLPAYRFWDPDVDVAGESPSWRAALAAAKADPTPVPKLAIFADTVPVRIVPLPADEADTLALLRSHGGP